MNSDTKKVSFNKEKNLDFTTTLRNKINNYFKDCEISSKANGFMILKSIFWVGAIIATYTLLMLNLFGPLGVLINFLVLGVVIAIGTMNISHDALHGAYVSNSIGNRALGLFMDLAGASSFYWKKEHTVDHHTFTNIAGHDCDLNAPILLRLCPEAPYRRFHRFQHWYAPLLYSLNLIRWVYYSDLKRVFKNLKKDSVEKSPLREIFLLLSFKILHVVLFLVLPMIFLSVAWWQVALSYIGLLAIAGVTLTVVFQLAHIVENVTFPTPDKEGKIENNFTTHQLVTTSNFGTRSKVVSFLFGGLNFQVEHHIFPHVCHTHLYKIAPLVKETATEFGIPYNENPTFFHAVRSHFRTLKKLGKSALKELNKAPHPI